MGHPASHSPMIACQLAVCFAALAIAVPVEHPHSMPRLWRPVTPLGGFSPVARSIRQFRTVPVSFESFIPLGASIPLQNEKVTDRPADRSADRSADRPSERLLDRPSSVRLLRPTRQEYDEPATGRDLPELRPAIRPLEREPERIRPVEYVEPAVGRSANPDVMFPVTRPLPEPSKRPLPASLVIPNDPPKSNPVAPPNRHEGSRQEEERAAYRALDDEASRTPVSSSRPSDAGNSLSRRTYQQPPSRTLFDSSSSTFARRIFGAPPSPIDLGFPAISSTQDNWNFDVNWAEFGRRRRRRAAAAASPAVDRRDQRRTQDSLAVESRRSASAETRVPAPSSNRRPEPARPEARSVQRRPVQQIGAAERRERERAGSRPQPQQQRVPERRESRPESRPESRRQPPQNRAPERREREGSPEARRQKPNHKDDKQEYDGPYIYTQLFGPPYEVGYIRSPVPSKHVYEDYLQFVRSWSSASRDAVDGMVRKNPAVADQYKDTKYLPGAGAANKDYKDDGYSGGKDSAYKDDGYDSKPAYKDESYDSKPAYKDESYDSKPAYKDESYDSKPAYKDESYDSKPAYKDEPAYDTKPSAYKDDAYDSKPVYKDDPYPAAKPSAYKDDPYDSKPAYKDEPYSAPKPASSYKDDPYDSKPAYKDDPYDAKPAAGYKDDAYDSKPAYKDESYDSKPGKDYGKDDGYKSTPNYHSPAPGYKAPDTEFLPGSKPYQSGSAGGAGYDDGPAYDILKPFQKAKPSSAAYSSGSSYETSAKPSYDSGYDSGKKYDAPSRPGTASSTYYETPTRYVEPPPYGGKDSYKSDGYKSDSYDAPTATYVAPTKSSNAYDDGKDYKDASYSAGGDGYSSGGNKYDVDLSSSSYQKVEQNYDSGKDAYASGGGYDAKPDDGYGKDAYAAGGGKDAYAGDAYDDKSKPADYSSSSGGKKKHYPVIIGRYQVTDSTAFLPKKVGGDKGGSYSTGSGGAVGSHVHGANGEEYVVYYLPYGQPLPVPVRRRRSADPGVVGYKSLADRPARSQRIRARHLEVLTPAEVQELLKNPVPLAYKAVDADSKAGEAVKVTEDAPQVTAEETAAPQVAVEEAIVDDKPVTLVSFDGLDEHAAAVAAQLSASDLPESQEVEDVPADPAVTVESTAQVENPAVPADESDAAGEINDDSPSVTPSIVAQEEVVEKDVVVEKEEAVVEKDEAVETDEPMEKDQVTESPVAEVAPVAQEEEKPIDESEPELEHAVGEIIIVADVEVPEGDDAPLPAVEGDVSVLEFLSEANAAGQLKPVDVDVRDQVQHPAWAPSADKKKYPKKAIETVGVVPGLTQKPVEYIKPPGIADKEARNWNGYSTWWTKLGNRVAKLYNYE